MKITSWKGSEIWTDFVWKMPNKAEPEPPKKEESRDVKFPEKDGNLNKEEMELFINKWKENSKKYVEDQFAVMRQKLKTAIDKIADLVPLPPTSTTGSSSTLSEVKLSTKFPNLSPSEPTDDVGRKLYAALQGISKARLIEKGTKPLAQLAVGKQPEAALAQEQKSVSEVASLESTEDAEKSLESVNCKPGEVENPSASATLIADEVENPSPLETLVPGQVENPSALATLIPDEVDNKSASETLIADEVENPSPLETLVPGQVENPSALATLLQSEVDNKSASEPLVPGQVENPLALATLIPGEVENQSALETLVPGEVENPSASVTNESVDAEKDLTSASTEQYTTEDEASRSVNQTIFYLINRLTSAESPEKVFKNVDSDELRLQLERFCLELGECSQKIGGLQQSLKENVLDSFEKNQTIVEFFARDALLVKGHSVPRTREQTQTQFDVLLKLVKEYIQPLKCNYDIILDDVVCCLETKNKILDMVEKFCKLDLTEKSN